ncbi:MAG TPA: DUF2336 domain-containing protein [Xanthobacteraceae bacterium]
MGQDGESIALIHELEQALTSGSSERRTQMLRRVTDLFLDRAPKLSEQQTAVFDEVIDRLADKMELRIRQELAEKLALTPLAPPNITRRLATQEIEVARAILVNSTTLCENDLVAIASEADQPHLLSISERAVLSSRVTDVLVQRGDQQVVRSVAGNDGASFSDFGFAAMVEKAGGDEVLQERLGARRDLPKAHTEALLQVATERVRQRLLTSGQFDGDSSAARTMRALADDVLKRPASRDLDYITATAAVDEVERACHGIGRNELVGFAAAGREAELIVALARMSGLPIETIEGIWRAEPDDGVIILAKALGLDWPTTREIIRASPDRASVFRNDIPAKKYVQLSPQVAQRVVRFWKVRQASLAPAAAAAG